MQNDKLSPSLHLRANAEVNHMFFLKVNSLSFFLDKPRRSFNKTH